MEWLVLCSKEAVLYRKFILKIFHRLEVMYFVVCSLKMINDRSYV